MTTRQLARTLRSEFMIISHTNGRGVSENDLIAFLERELLKGRTTWDTERPNVLWAYFAGRRIKFERHKGYAEQCADGFTWDNPRVRKVAIIYPEACK